MRRFIISANGMRKKFKRFNVVLAAAVVFLLAELSARYTLSRLWTPGDGVPMLAAFGKPIAQDSSLQDPAALYHDTHWQFEGGAIIPSDYTSPALNYKGGYRVTTGQPERYNSTVWLLGASGLVGTELTDDQTIASQLQLLLPDKRVVNVGMSGANIAQIESRINELTMNPGDLVIVLGGSIESLGTWRQVSAATGTRLTDGLCPVILHHIPLSLVRLMCWQTQFTAPAAYDDRLFAIATDQHKGYAAAVERMRQAARARGVQFVNALMPFCFCSQLNDYEGMTRSFVAFTALARQDEQTLDLSRLIPDDLFFSQFHVNAEGARLVADALAKAIPTGYDLGVGN